MIPVKRWLQSVQARVLAATVVGMALALALTGLSLLHVFRLHAERQFQAQLTLHMHQVLARLTFTEDGEPTLDSQDLSDPRWTHPFGGLYWQVSQTNGTVVQRSRSLWDQVLDLPADAPGTGEVHRYQRKGPAGQPLLVLEQSVVPPEAEPSTPRWTIAVAAQTGPLEEAVDEFSGALAATLVLLLVLLAGAAAAQVWVGLAPLRAVQHSLERLNAGKSQRLEGRWPSEVQPLAQGFNQALDRLDHHLQTARTQAGNLAHALKTPLAILRQAAEPLTTTDKPDSGCHALAQQVLDQVAQAQQQVDRHLRRARSAALAGHRFSTPLLPALQGLLRVMDKVHAERGLETALVHTGAPTQATTNTANTATATATQWNVAVEAQDLHDMLGNVLDNACRWANRRVVVRVQALPPQGHTPPMLALTVEDDGPGIAPEHLPRVLQRGQRLDEQLPGSGLGLAIVEELAQLHGASLHIQNRADGTSGLSVALHLPLALKPPFSPS